MKNTQTKNYQLLVLLDQELPNEGKSFKFELCNAITTFYSVLVNLSQVKFQFKVITHQKISVEIKKITKINVL